MMTTMTGSDRVARKRADKEKRNVRGEGIPVRIDPDIVGKAKVVAFRGIPS